MQSRILLALAANRIASHLPGAPSLSLTSTKDDLESWLQACDPNGIHVTPAPLPQPEDPDLEPEEQEGGYDSIDDAWDAVASMIEANR